MKYLVTGGCGFIGSHLCRALAARGDAVTVLDDLSSGRADRLVPGARLIQGDVADPETVASAVDGVDGVFHLAAIASVQQCNEEWRESHLTNQLGSVTLFEAARRAGRIPVVYTSSAAIYGDVATLPIVESLCPAPQTAYGADKLGTELHARVAQTVHGVRTVGLRPFNVYGPGQDPHSPYSGVISIFAERMMAGQPFAIFGDGHQTRDFVFVEDAVRFFLAAMALDNPQPEVFNVATGRQTSLLDLIGILSDVTGAQPDFCHGPGRAGDIRHSCGSTVRARDILGVSAASSLADGLATTFSGAPSP